MTMGILSSMNLWESVSKNASSQVPTGDFLVNQLRAGSLDAAVVYRINIQQQAEHFDAVSLPADKARAIQPFAVRSRFKLAPRILRMSTRDASPACRRSIYRR
jgi:hypothetical protein